MFLLGVCVEIGWIVAHATREEFCLALRLLDHFPHLLAFFQRSLDMIFVAFLFFVIPAAYDTLLASGFITFHRSIVTAFRINESDFLPNLDPSTKR